PRDLLVRPLRIEPHPRQLQRLRGRRRFVVSKKRKGGGDEEQGDRCQSAHARMLTQEPDWYASARERIRDTVVRCRRRKDVEVSIRSGEPRDVHAVLRLMRELAEHEGHSQYFELASEGLHQACFAEPHRIELIVAEAEGEVVGYATCMLQFSPWMGRDYLFLDDLYVRDELRGLGIGSRLLKHVGVLALERGIDVRWHVEIENRSAQKLYRAFGAVLREKLIAYWPTDAI